MVVTGYGARLDAVARLCQELAIKGGAHTRKLDGPGPRFLMINDSQIPESGLKLVDVVKFNTLTQPWQKLDSDDRFSEFHAKFWGKSMADDEREWRNLTTLPSDHSGDDISMDYEYGDTGVTDADMDVDVSDEFIPGCYELDISPNPVSDVETIWIRADYVRVYNYTESKYDLCYKRRRAQGVVITGQPGGGECVSLYPLDILLIIDEGKSVSLVYVLRRRCAEKKPVVWYEVL